MKFSPVAVAACLALFLDPSEGFMMPSSSRMQLAVGTLYSTVEAVETENATSNPKKGIEKLTTDIVSKLRFREVQRELEARQLDTTGTFTSMKQRLLHVATQEGGVSGTNGESKQEKAKDIRVIDQESLNSVSDVMEFDSFDCP
jgi:hypothetical protein